MSILVIGLNHKTAPIQLREQVYCSRNEIVKAFHYLAAPPLSECAILSTCNRTEIYAVTDDVEKARVRIETVLAARAQMPASKLAPHLFTYLQKQAARHLCAVASGIDSMMLGEFEIQHQVIQAFELAQEHDAVGALLSRLFMDAIHTGKRARTETQIGARAISIASAAVQVAQQTARDLKSKRVLLVGAGELGARVAKNLAAQGAATILISNRHYDTAVELARMLDGEALHFDELENALRDADVVIAATGAPFVVIHSEWVARAMNTRPTRPLCLIDIAVPRNIESRAGEIENVRLYNLDELQNLVEQNRAARAGEIAHVHRIIDEQVSKYWEWQMTRRAAPLFATLHARADAIRSTELKKTLRQFPNLNDAERAVLENMTRVLTKKLLAAPTRQLQTRIQSGDGDEYLKMLRELFLLDQEEEKNR